MRYENIGFDNILNYEKELLNYAQDQIRKIEGVEIYGDSINKTPIVSFNIKGIHPYDIGSVIDNLGVAVRTGHHCTEPIMTKLCIPGTVRASFAAYSTFAEVDALVAGVNRAANMLR